MATIDAIREILNENLDIDPADVTPEASLEDLGIDSLDTVEMVMELEDKLDMEIELDKKVATIGELVDFIEELK